MFLGIDIGGTTISIGIVNGTEIVKRTTVPSFPENASLQETIDYLVKIISETTTPEVTKIGVGVPTVVNQETGTLYEAANIPSWHEVPLKQILEKEFGVEVEVNNDANCFALGAAALKGYPSKIIAAVTLGTGTGIGLVVDKKLISGENSGLGEISSLPYRGMTYEDFCSKKFFTANGFCAKEAYELAKKGDRLALAVMDEFGANLGQLLKAVMFAYDPGCIILGGGIANSFDLFEAEMWKVLKEEFPYKKSIEKLQIITSSEPDAALIGASLL